MWIVKVALSRPYTFIVLALLILLVSPIVIMRTPTDIFPNINIPVISAIWTYTGLNPEEFEGRITTVYEKVLTTTVNDIEHIESTTLNGTAVVKVFSAAVCKSDHWHCPGHGGIANHFEADARGHQSADHSELQRLERADRTACVVR